MPRTFPSLATGYKPGEGRRASSPRGWIIGPFEVRAWAESGCSARRRGSPTASRHSGARRQAGRPYARLDRAGLHRPAGEVSDPAFPWRSIFGPVHPASKTALNVLAVALATEFAPEGIKVNAVSPGFTKTNLNNYEGAETVEQGAREAARVALLGPSGPTGTFTHWKTRQSRGDRSATGSTASFRRNRHRTAGGGRQSAGGWVGAASPLPDRRAALAARRWLAAGLDRFDKGVEFEPIGERVAFEEEIENFAAAAPANMRARRAAKLGSKRRLKPIVSGALVLATTSRQRRIRSTSRATGPRRCRSGHVCTAATGGRSARK